MINTNTMVKIMNVQLFMEQSKQGCEGRGGERVGSLVPLLAPLHRVLFPVGVIFIHAMHSFSRPLEASVEGTVQAPSTLSGTRGSPVVTTSC